MLTRRAARLLAQAEVVVLDRRSLAGIAELAPPAAERHFVGKTADGPGWETQQIAQLLANCAQAGRVVVRLKSGDPFVCSRGGEERLALLERGIECEVVPGVTAATAAPLASGFRRGRTVTILAGNEDPLYPALDIAVLADPLASLVVLTGRAHQRTLATELMAAGLAPSTPASVIHAATRPGQQIATCTLSDLGTCHLPAPTTVVIGPAPDATTEDHRAYS